MLLAMESYDAPLNPDPLLEHAAWIRKLAFELVQDPGAADDLVQETWLAFLRARPDTDRPLRPWLGRVVRNAAALRARRRAGQSAREAEVARAEEMPSTHDLVERAEQQQRLVHAVLALDDPYRSTILLRYFEGLTPKEIAALRELPAATVRTHLHRGLQQLRERLDEEHGGDRRAWVLLLRPLLPQPELAAAGVSVAGVLAGVSLALLGLFGLYGSLGDDLQGTFGLENESETAAVLVDAAENGAAERGARIPAFTALAPAPPGGLRELDLVDERTGAPLVAFLLRVGDRDLVSDDRGRVEIVREATSATPIDHPRLAVERIASHGRRERLAPQRASVALPESGELALPVGPTFRVDLTRSPGVALAELEGRLTADGLSEFTEDALPRELAPLRTPAAGDLHPWLRFAGLPRGSNVSGAAWRLEVRDETGFAWGSARLDDPVPLDVPRVEVELRATSVLTGRIEGVTAVDLRKAVVSLHRRDDPERVVAWTRLDDDGRYALLWIEPGDHELRVTAPVSEPVTRDVTLVAAQRHVEDVSLTPYEVAGPLAGEIESASGQYRGQLLVFLFHGERVLDVYPTTWSAGSDGRLTARFAFEDVPVGGLRIDVLSLADAVTFQQKPTVLRAPDEAVRVRLLDEEPTADCGFEVVDAATGRALERFEVELRIDGGAPRRFLHDSADGASSSGGAASNWVLVAGGMRWNRFSGQAPLRALPRSADITWTVRAEGFAAVSGDSGAFRYAEDGLRVAHVLLRSE